MNTTLPDHRLRDVEVASLQLRRIYRVIRETMRAMSGFILAAPSLEIKRLLARHAWIDSTHADALRRRVLELRYPRVDVDDDMPPVWRELLSFLPRANNSAEFIAGVYHVVKPRLIKAMESYLVGSDAIDDAPSQLILKRAITEINDELGEAIQHWSQLSDSERAAAGEWQKYLHDAFETLGGFEVAALNDPPRALPVRAGFSDRLEFRVPAVPARDPSFEPAVMQVPPRQPRNGVESRIWLAIDHANETWAGEVPSGLIWEYPNAPWETIRDSTRWSYDEMRHAMMGERRLRKWGFRPGHDYPVVSDHFGALSEAGYGLVDALLLLHALELSGPHWKSSLVREFQNLGDRNSAVDCDYDWADEAGHIAVGLAWTRFLMPDMTKKQVIEKHGQLKDFWANWMRQRQIDGTHGYQVFMPRIEKLAAEIATREGSGADKPAKLSYGGTDVFDFDMPSDTPHTVAES